METIGERLRKFRESKGIKQKELAGLLGIKGPALNRIEKGNVDITVRHLLKLVENFSLSLDWLVLGRESGYHDNQDFGEFTLSVGQMVEDMRHDPEFLHGILSHYHLMKARKRIASRDIIESAGEVK